jgi:DASS family divalent anion:Na+ symporter
MLQSKSIQLEYLSLPKSFAFFRNRRLFYALFLIGLIFLPKPDELPSSSWNLFLIFLGTIVGIMTQIFPMGAIALIAISACAITKTLTIQQTLSAFSSPIGWLIFTAFLLARGFIKTGLGSRIAYCFIQIFGKSTLGLSYSLVLSEVLLSPITPSNTARGAGILFPVIFSISQGLGSDPKKKTEKRVGAYLMLLGYQTNVLTCSLFLTSSAANPLLAQLAKKFGIEISWTNWAMAALIPGLVSIVMMPLILYGVFPPELKKTPEAPRLAQQKLKKMGPIQSKEYFVIGIFALLLGLWVFGPSFGVDATSAALVGVSLMLIFEVLTFDDLLKESNAWSTFLWMSTLIMICQGLSDAGVIEWFGGFLGPVSQGINWPIGLGILILLNFFIHYIFASTTAHISALFSMLVGVAISAGSPPALSVLLMAFSSNLCAGITHYGTGPGPIYFGEGYVSLKDWWIVGGKLGFAYLLIWGIFGPIWWKLIGLW